MKCGAAGFEPLTPTAGAGLRPLPTRQVVAEGGPRPARQVVPQPRGMHAVRPCRPCPPPAPSVGSQEAPTVNTGQPRRPPSGPPAADGQRDSASQARGCLGWKTDRWT